MADPPYRSWIAGAVTVVVANAATTAIGAVTLVRYAAVNSPFLLLISALTVASLLDDGARVGRHGPVRRDQRDRVASRRFLRRAAR